MKSIFSDIISFLKNPYSQTNPVLSKKDKFLYLLRLGIFTFIINFIFAVLVVIEQNILKKFGIEIKQVDIEFNKAYLLVFMVFFAPFFEELIFRLPLSFRKKDINVSLFALLMMAGFILSSIDIFVSQNRTTESLIKYGILFAGVGIVYFFNTKTEDSLEKIKTLFGKYFIYASIIIFALVHLFNISNLDLPLFPIYLFNLLPIFLLGTVITLCRVRLGFFYGFLFHAAWNFLPALIKIFV